MTKIHYLGGRMSRGFVSITTARMILNTAGSLLGLYLPIFLYQVFDLQADKVVIYYFLFSFFYMGFVAFGARYLNKIGLRRSLRISIIMGALYFLLFYFVDIYHNGGFAWDHWLIFSLLLASIIINVLNKMMYWIPVHTDMSKFTNKKNRGKQLSLLSSVNMFIAAVTPFVSGWILSYYNYDVLFIMAIIIYLLSLIPLMHIPRTRERFVWGYFETWKKLFSRKRRKMVAAFVGDGMEGSIRIIIWPIFIFELLEGNYFEVGLITSLVVVASITLQLTVGKYLDLKSKGRMLHIGTILYAIGWVFKFFVASAFQIFAVSTYHRLTNIFTRTTFDAMFYENAADNGHFVDEYSVLHEMALMLGRVISFGFIFILLQFAGMNWTFFIAMAGTLIMNLMSGIAARE